MTPSVTYLAAGDGNLPLLILMVVLIGLIMWRMTRRRSAAGKSCAPRPRRARSEAPAAAAGDSRQQLSRSMQDLLLELEQLSREINSQVDTRLRALNLLIQEADEKIKELRLLQGGDADGPPPSRNLPPPRPEPHPEATSERYARVYALAERGRSVVEIAREMEMMTGEVELILALRRTAANTPQGRAR